ncbi:muconolactone Delta-isomerase family protein [Nocardioides speluncae]|nr:muconolactone Delta-isomerase family protein [Nocardioides speluncae]
MWPQLWRIVGEYANISIFDVASNDELSSRLLVTPD